MLKKTEPVGHIHDIVQDKATTQHRVLCITPVISELKTLDELIGCKVTHTPLMLNNACAVIVHGEGRPLRKVLSASTALELELLYTDFGPLKTFDHKKEQSLSLTVDHLGPMNASDRETYLESLIKTVPTDEALARAENLITQWKDTRASRYNGALGPILPNARFVTVLAEPTPFGGNKEASKNVTTQLIAKAQNAFPTHQVVVVKAGDYAADALATADAAFVSTSPIGFEALLWGTPLYVSGMPFYAGWGLTEDELPAPPRRDGLAHGLAQLVNAYMVEYTRYVSPYDAQRMSPEDALKLLANTREAAVEHAREKQQLQEKMPSWLKWLNR